MSRHAHGEWAPGPAGRAKAPPGDPGDTTPASPTPNSPRETESYASEGRLSAAEHPATRPAGAPGPQPGPSGPAPPPRGLSPAALLWAAGAGLLAFLAAGTLLPAGAPWPAPRPPARGPRARLAGAVLALEAAAEALVARAAGCVAAGAGPCGALAEEARGIGLRLVALEDAAHDEWAAAVGAPGDAGGGPGGAAGAPGWAAGAGGWAPGNWVEGALTEVVVGLSRVHSLVRGDGSGERAADGAQAFLRRTTKYLVRPRDLTRVKLALVERLPVFRYDPSKFDGDAQLVSSVYLDSPALDLHRETASTATKSIRLRWYGEGPPGVVYVERKTRGRRGCPARGGAAAWAWAWMGLPPPGEAETYVTPSRKDRFPLDEDRVLPFLRGDLSADEAAGAAEARGARGGAGRAFRRLFREVQAEVAALGLGPSVRTHYHRSAFQVPYDAAVRLSLDTRVCMTAERNALDRWYRDPADVAAGPATACTPFALLEVKIEGRGDGPPAWLQELVDGGLLVEGGDFSKFPHGSSGGGAGGGG